MKRNKESTEETNEKAECSEKGEENPLQKSRSDSACSSLVPITDDYDSTKHQIAREKLDRAVIKDLMDRWRSAARRARQEYVDPWDQFNIQDYPIQRVKRHRYSAIKKQWTEDFIEVRLHPEPFARGAMRECYRMKKLSSMGGSTDWAHAQNYVAKKYMQNVERRTLFDDVKLQMDAKLWAEEFNRYKPPKKIDIVQMCVIEFIDIPENPLFHLEHFIEGDYLKYNSNSGFVSKDARLTPQAFSHFTFERSGHQLMVVDIQGVGDLYTDPQIHTVVGTDYGDGNLGTRGMALFFRSHKCNYICQDMDLSQFELSENELAELMRARITSTSGTVYNRNRMNSENCLPVDNGISMDALRRLTGSVSQDVESDEEEEDSSSSEEEENDEEEDDEDEDDDDEHDDDCVCSECIPKIEDLTDNVCDSEDSRSVASSHKSPQSKVEIEEPIFHPRKVGFHSLKVVRPDSAHFDSMSLESSDLHSLNSSRLTRDTEREDFWKNTRKMSIPANIAALKLAADVEQAELRTRQFSVLGQIHIDLARYHELGRFLEEDVKGLGGGKNNKSGTSKSKSRSRRNEHRDDFEKVDYDKESAVFHLDVARKCGVLEAVLTTAYIALDMPHELLKDVTVDELFDDQDVSKIDLDEFGAELMESAAEMGEKSAMMYMAKAYETGQRLGNQRCTDYKKAIDWYQRVVGFQDDDDSENTTASPMARHEILAKMAEMYKEGGYGLRQDFERAYNLFTEAADAAMEAMHGKLANKYYEKAEMCAY